MQGAYKLQDHKQPDLQHTNWLGQPTYRLSSTDTSITLTMLNRNAIMPIADTSVTLLLTGSWLNVNRS
jgi:hypothetical protein